MHPCHADMPPLPPPDIRASNAQVSRWGVAFISSWLECMLGAMRHRNVVLADAQSNSASASASASASSSSQHTCTKPYSESGGVQNRPNCPSRRRQRKGVCRYYSFIQRVPHRLIIIVVSLILLLVVLNRKILTKQWASLFSSKNKEIPFVVVASHGVKVYSMEEDASASGTLPFGSILILRLRDRDSYIGPAIQIIFPYEGYLIHSYADRPKVLPLVGDLSSDLTERSQKRTPQLHCCDINKYKYGKYITSNVTWDEFNDGQYSSVNCQNDDMDDFARVENHNLLRSRSPAWTIQYQPADGTETIEADTNNARGNKQKERKQELKWSTSPTWLDQVPVGSGRTGALVGSSASASIIPISTAGLFVPPRAAAKKPKKRYERKDGEIFHEARQAFLNGQHDTAEDLVKLLHQQSANENPMASFEYASDLTLIFTDTPIRLRKNDGIGASARRKNKAGFSERDILVDNLVSSVEMYALGNQTNAGPRWVQALKQILARGQLDMENGVYHESFVSAGTRQTQPNANTRNTNFSSSHHKTVNFLHHREYFASLNDHIVAMRFQCRRMDELTKMAECLNFAAKLSRKDSGGSVSSQSWSVPLTMAALGNHTVGSTTQRDLVVEADALTRRSQILFGVTISQNDVNSFLAPDAEICGVLICRGDNNKTMAETNKNGEIICSSASSADLFLAVELSSKGNDLHSIPRSPDELKRDCKRRLVMKALQTGYDDLRKAHSEKFGEIMLKTDIHFAERNQEESKEDSGAEIMATCDGHVISDLLVSMGLNRSAACRSSRSNSTEPNAVVSPSLLRSQFHFSRYLLLSTASDAVPNLQGIWADGPVSAWSGDYHANVNLQMMYWGLGAVGLSTLLRPLLSFIESLARVGQIAARKIYNASSTDAWLTHGNTDHTLDGSLRADSFWVFSPLCGLWAALVLGEHLLYVGFDDTTSRDLLRALKIFRGAIRFVEEYTFLDSAGVRQTGPSSSPENSYLLYQHSTSVGNRKTPASLSARHLALTPSFDVSIIRQLSNVFTLLTTWASDMLDQSNYPEELRNKDKTIAKNFVQLSLEMPFGGQPVVGDNGIVLEYPAPLGSCVPHVELSSVANKCKRDEKGGGPQITVGESPDPGHRHFSGLLWLYPNSFLPLSNGEELIDAAQRTVDIKFDAGGGHTGWSASWMAALRARLRDGRGCWNSMAILIKHYTARNGLKLHPPLGTLNSNSYSFGGLNATSLDKGCVTCFTEEDQDARGVFYSSTQARGLETSRSDKFQLDGHGGLVAALAEFMLMSHIPGVLIVLPGLSGLNESPNGFFRGLRARGDIDVSATWSGRGSALTVDKLTLVFSSRHPWLFGSRWLESQGYYTPEENIESGAGQKNTALLRIFVPAGDEDGKGLIRLQKTSTCARQLDESSFISKLGKEPQRLPTQLTTGLEVLYLSVIPPCEAQYGRS